MCGIVGVVYGPNGAAAEKWTPAESAELMFPNVEHRGTDSFGWIHRRAEGSIQLRKFAEAASKGIEKVKVDHRFGIPNDAQWWIGHVRYATHGTAKYTHNNHPIVHGDIMGVHNGIVYNYTTVLNSIGRQHKKAEVDSEAIFAAINEYGIYDGLDKLDALAAIVWVDRKDPDKVRFATCDANPLILAKSKGGATYFASESWILEELGIEWAEEPWKMADYTLFTIENGEDGEYVQWADPNEKYRQGFGKSYTYSSYSSYGRQAWEDDDIWYNSQTGRQGSGVVDPTKDSDTTDGSDFEDDVECLNCNWSGDEWECDNGDCPNCGSYAYLVPKGFLQSGSDRDAVVAETDSAIIDDPNSPPWIKDMAKARTKADNNLCVVCEDGTVVTKQQYDDFKIAEAALKPKVVDVSTNEDFKQAVEDAVDKVIRALEVSEL